MPTLATVCTNPLGVSNTTWYVPGGSPVKLYSPPLAVTCVASNWFVTQLYSRTVTPSMPGSPASCTPSPSLSSNTLSPMLTGAYTPASSVVLFSPAASVTTCVLPVLSASLSVVSLPWLAAVNTVPAGALNCTWYCSPTLSPLKL